MNKIIILLFLFIPSAVFGAHIFPVGDSFTDYEYQNLIDYPPVKSTIDTTGQSLNYAGATLEEWKTGRGSGVCEGRAFYGCLEATTHDINIILIPELGYNDMYFSFRDGAETYNGLGPYLHEWREFYEWLHEDFPDAVIVHATGYPMQVADNSCTTYWYSGTTVSVNLMACNDALSCARSDNARYHGFINMLMAGNSDLDYVRYIDTWHAILVDNPEGAELNTWTATYLDDCVHLNYTGADGVLAWTEFSSYLYLELNRIIKGLQVNIYNTSLNNSNLH